jgi:hypothetical protein
MELPEARPRASQRRGIPFGLGAPRAYHVTHARRPDRGRSLGADQHPRLLQ